MTTNNLDRMFEVQISKEERNKLLEERRILDKKNRKMYLGEIIDIEKPVFGSNNMIVAPVGSGKSYLIENQLIPDGFEGDILYLVSNTALKDSLAPNNKDLRKRFAENGKSKGFFTTQNKDRFGDVNYKVHVMTYHEFGRRVSAPHETFTNDIELVFCDEIHSPPIYTQYGDRGEMLIALRWVFNSYEDKTIYYFTATEDSIDRLENESPGYLTKTKIFNYLEYPNIVKYQAKSTYYIRNTQQLKEHLEAKIDFIKYNRHKGLAFTSRISSQKKISEIAKSVGYTPIALWSINNEEHGMSDEQVRVRDVLLKTGAIPEPYNLIIINNAMQEGWSLYDKKVEFAILDTLDKTEQVQALGRIRKDIDFIILKVGEGDSRANNVLVRDVYLNKYLTPEDKDELVKELDLKNLRGDRVKWPTVKGVVSESGYDIEDSVRVVNGERRSVSLITEKERLKIS